MTTPLYFTPDTVLCLGSATTGESGLAPVPQLGERASVVMCGSGKVARVEADHAHSARLRTTCSAIISTWSSHE